MYVAGNIRIEVICYLSLCISLALYVTVTVIGVYCMRWANVCFIHFGLDGKHIYLNFERKALSP